MTIVDATL